MLKTEKRSFPLVMAAVLALALQSASRASCEGLRQKIDTLLASPDLAGGIQGVIVRSLADGSEWYSRGADLLFMPASNQKLLTSAAALHLLGPQFRFTTRLCSRAVPDRDGTLAGDLYLVGSGDPLLSDRDLAGMVRSLRQVGVRRVAGRVVADASLFTGDTLGAAWSWDYLSHYYAAPASALNLNKNVVGLRLAPAKAAGDPPTVTVEPAGAPVHVIVTARTGGPSAPTALSIERRLGRGWIEVGGTIAQDAPDAQRGPHWVTVPDPPLFAASVLTEQLRQAGIRVEWEPDFGTAPSDASPLVEHASVPLAELLPLLNKPSDNLIAECLLRAVGARAAKEGSVEAGAQAAVEWFRSLGLPQGGCRIVDGSGLSRLNLVSPRLLAGLLEQMARRPDFDVFKNSLPIAGKDGTLRNRLRSTAAEGNLRAKTGYIGYVSSLSGYLHTRSGEPLLVVILMNHHLCPPAAARAVQDSIIQALVEAEGKPE